MQLRNLTIPYAQPAVFAPMAGFTDAACRHLMADHGAAWTVSEMASAKAITFGDDKSVRLLRDKASHGIYAVQLFGAEPETMAQAIRIIQALPRWEPGKMRGEKLRVIFFKTNLFRLIWSGWWFSSILQYLMPEIRHGEF